MKNSRLRCAFAFLTLICIFLYACQSDDSELHQEQEELIDPWGDEPHISGFSPIKGTEGSEFTITGKGFGNDPNAILVHVNGTLATLVSVTDRKIVAKVPYWSTSGTINVQKVQSPLEFDLVTHSPFEVIPQEFDFIFDPLQGYEGDTTTLYLENFDPNAFEYGLTLNGIPVEVNEAQAGFMMVTLPQGAETAPFILSMNGQTFETDLPFTMAPVITDLTPLEALPRITEITVNGRNFGSQPSLAINGVAIPILQLNGDGAQLTFTYPITYSGELALTVQGPEGPLVANAPAITVHPPEIHNFPSPVDQLETIVIDGAYFASEIVDNQVFFQGPNGTNLEATVLAASADQLQVQVPLNARVGPITVTTYGVPELTDTSTPIQINPWRQLPDLPIARRKNAFCGVINGDIYVGTGRLNANRLDDFYAYRTATGTWEQLAPFPGGPIEGTFYFTLNNTLYVGGGRDAANVPNNSFWSYSPDQGWIQLNDFGAPDNFRVFATAVSIGTSAYVYGGMDIAGNTYNDFWKYNVLTDTWTQKAGFEPSGRLYAVGFGLGNQIYLGTGLDDVPKKLLSFKRYDPNTDSWSNITYFPENRHSANGFSADGRAFVINGKSFTQLVREYDPQSNSWIQKANFPGEVRRGGNVAAVSDQAYVLFGEGYGYPTDFWEYTPENDTP
nr:IPT/TIG domain-containing protein [Allomuricauda sp.]